MNKLLSALLLLFFPVLALAADSLSFAPPPSDYSVIFLGNLFGMVDGVLHSSGSQMMGQLFAVFNASVLALSGIVIMYTLLVSTMNTAHEGQMLGQKWSSIWIPVRSTIGIALLIPKASGYCLMQIFFMWIVVQGVGAADKVWEAALSYLNRGGVIIQAQANPADALVNASNSGVANGAFTILAGQTCMLGLENQLKTQRKNYLNEANNGTGPCAHTPSDSMKTFCDTAVPDFLGTVNTVIAQNANPNANSFSVPMPNFDTTSTYNYLNGICGTLTWNAISGLNDNVTTTGSGNSTNQVTLTSQQMETSRMSRAIAIQQMYLDLSTVAQEMINNDPGIGLMNSDSNNYSIVANQQFGVPLTQQGTVCTNYQDTCVLWGTLPTSTGAGGGVLFNGTEFQGAIADYNGIMLPTLNLMQQSSNADVANQERAFINQANMQGWIMAGSYFFDLVALNGNATALNANTDSSKNLTDTDTGMDGSTFDPSNLTSSFNSNGSCSGTYATLCTWFSADSGPLNAVTSLINGTSVDSTADDGSESTAVPAPDMNADGNRNYTGDLKSSTVYGFVNNSMMVQLPGQPGIAPLQFANLIHFKVDPKMYYLPKQHFDCNFMFPLCLGKVFGHIFYDLIFRHLYNFFLLLMTELIDRVVMAFLLIPLTGMSAIFHAGLNIITKPGVNPIIALANMGVMYINFAANLWIMLLNLAITSAMIPIFGVFVFALMTMGMPLLLAWLGVMVSIGFTTAYYVPMLPYMIFTFGAIAWLMAVIEAMVAAPLVALGITHPEGHDAFGKGESALMILMNIFLRPSMMIIGYIAGIALSYVGIWVINAGFDHAIAFIQSGETTTNTHFWGLTTQGHSASGSGGYTSWAGIYAYFFSILVYTSMYLVVVQKSFTLISVLPDKVLRWIGGQPESYGSEAGQWGEDAKKSVGDAGKGTSDAQGQMGKQMGATAMSIGSGALQGMQNFSGGGGQVSAQGGGGSGGDSGGASGGNAEATPSAAPGGSGSGAAGQAAQVVEQHPEMLLMA